VYGGVAIMSMAVGDIAMSLHSNAPSDMPAAGNGSLGGQTGRRLLRTADRLSLAAAPTFALMALHSATRGGAEMLCSSTQDVFAPGGMVTMYALMSAFHLAPWLKLISSHARSPGPS
jgi:hypothetical protein